MAKEELVMLVNGSYMAMKGALNCVPSDEAFVSARDAEGKTAAFHSTNDVRAKEELANALRAVKGKVAVDLGIPESFMTRMEAHFKLNDAHGLLVGAMLGFDEDDFWQPNVVYATYYDDVAVHANEEFAAAGSIRIIFAVGGPTP